MKTTVGYCDFERAFRDMDRLSHFPTGLSALWDYLEEMEEDTGEELELDVIGLCCDYTEYADLSAFQADYDVENYPDMESVQDATTVIMIDDTAFIIQAF